MLGGKHIGQKLVYANKFSIMGFETLFTLNHSDTLEASNPLGPKGDQHQFSPSNIRTSSINKTVTKGKMKEPIMIISSM